MSGNSHALLSEIFKDGKQLLYERGDTIIRAGDTPSGVYLITEGWVKVYCLCDDGEVNIISSLARADIFPLEWAISGTLHDVTFAALDTTSVIRIPRERFTRILGEDPRVAQAMSRTLADYYFRLSNELENLPYRSARERVVFRLLSLAERFGDARAQEVVIKLRVPNEYIARSSNMTRETASREISRLHHKGLIEHKHGYIIIKNLAALRDEGSRALSWQNSPL
jgi:CRP/FNR family transcriptional regulator, cyclic AMP receptor protein